MKKIFIIFGSMVLFHSLCTANALAEPQASSQEPNQPAYLKPIPPEKLKEDLDFLFRTIEEVHPNMYAYTSKEKFSKLREKLYQQAIQPMTSLEFYKAVAPVVTAIRNSHTRINTPDISQELIVKRDRVFPLLCEWDGQNLILADNYSDANIPEGSIITKIDNDEAGKLISKYARYCQSDRNLGNPYSAAHGLQYFFWVDKGDTDSYGLQIRTASGDIKDLDIKALTYDEIVSNAQKKVVQTQNRGNYSYRYITEYDTALIEFNSCIDSPKFKEFLEKTFGEIKKQKTSKLIIDIRKNGGGQSDVGDELLKYISKKPFRQFDKCKVKISPASFATIPNELKMREIGSVVEITPPFIQPVENQDRFNGTTYVLISPATASSAASFASAIKCFGIGKLVGEETIDTTASYGDMYTFSLPNSGLTANVSRKYLVDACGKEDGRGVLPDYEVKQKPEDTAKGVDTILQFTLNLIKEGGRSAQPKQEI